jgi:hypothetical protein
MRLRDVGTTHLFVNFGDTGSIVRAFVAASGSSIAPVPRHLSRKQNSYKDPKCA